MSLSRILLISKELSIWLHQYTNESEFNNVLDREKWAICLWQQALDIEDGIGVLLESNLPGASLALARPLLECYVRGVWLLNAATDDQIEKFLSGENKYYSEFSISKLAKDIGNDAETGGAWINGIIDAHIKVLHDLTHGGTSHILTRCFSDTVEPSYPEDNLISLVQLGIEVKIRSGAIILARMEKDEALNLLGEKAEKIRNSFQVICPDVSK